MWLGNHNMYVTLYTTYQVCLEIWGVHKNN